MGRDITDKIDQRSASALNVAKGYPLANALNAAAMDVCRSDADATLIFILPLLEQVRLQAICVTAPAGEAPTVVKLFANRATLGFEDLDDIDATQTLTLRPGDAAGAELRLKPGPAFGRVHSLAVYFEAEGGATCAVGKLRLVGEPLQTTDMSQWSRKEPEEGGGGGGGDD